MKKEQELLSMQKHLQSHPITYPISILNINSNGTQSITEAVLLPVVKKTTVMEKRDYSYRRRRVACFLLSDGTITKNAYYYRDIQVFMRVGKDLKDCGTQSVEIAGLRGKLIVSKLIECNATTKDRAIVFWRDHFHFPINEKELFRAILAETKLGINPKMKLSSCIDMDASNFGRANFMVKKFGDWLQTLELDDLLSGSFLRLNAKEVLENIAITGSLDDESSED